MEEAKNEYKITFGPYEIELVKSQVYFRKNGSLMKAMPVKSTFGLYDLKKLANKIAKSVNMTSKLPKDVLNADHVPGHEGLYEAYYVWSGTYGQDKPKKMKDLVKVKDLDASIKQSRKHKAKHGNARAMLDREFEKQFPKAFKSLDEKRIKLMGSEDEMSPGEKAFDTESVKESTAQWEKTIKALAHADALKKLKKGDKEKLLKIAQLLKKEKGLKEKVTGYEDPGTEIYPVKIINTEDYVKSGHMYKSLTYKVKDSKAVMAAYKKFKAGNRTINMVVKDSGDTVTISGHPTKGMWIAPSIADQLDAAIQKTGKAKLVKSDSKKLSEGKLRNQRGSIFDKNFRDTWTKMAETIIDNCQILTSAEGLSRSTIKLKQRAEDQCKSVRYLPETLADAIRKDVKGDLSQVTEDKKLGEEKMNESEIKFRKMIREMAEPMLKASMNEISVKAGLTDVIKGRTTSIEGIKFSKELADNLMYWIQTSPYGRKYGKHILKGRIASLIGPANVMGFGNRLSGKLKKEWKAIINKFNVKKEDVVEQLKEMQLTEMSDSQMLKMAMKGAKAARVGSAATKAYIDSLKNSWRLDPKGKKDYKDFSIDDWEEDVLYYIQNKG